MNEILLWKFALKCFPRNIKNQGLSRLEWCFEASKELNLLRRSPQKVILGPLLYKQPPASPRFRLTSRPFKASDVAGEAELVTF